MSCVDLAYISNEECIGNSLSSINGNFAALSAAVCDLSGGPSSSDLLTLINTLSTNMQNIGNYPYLEYAWVTAPNAAGQTITANTSAVLTLNTEVADSGNFGSLASSQITLSAGTYQYDIDTNIVAVLNSINPGVIIGIWNNNSSNWITRRGRSIYSGLDGPIFGLKGQFTIAAESIIDLRLIPTTSIIIHSCGYQASFTNSTANADQRTTIKLWKVG
jgi:hypothetical protein